MAGPLRREVAQTRAGSSVSAGPRRGLQQGDPEEAAPPPPAPPPPPPSPPPSPPPPSPPPPPPYAAPGTVPPPVGLPPGKDAAAQTNLKNLGAGLIVLVAALTALVLALVGWLALGLACGRRHDAVQELRSPHAPGSGMGGPAPGWRSGRRRSRAPFAGVRSPAGPGPPPPSRQTELKYLEDPSMPRNLSKESFRDAGGPFGNRSPPMEKDSAGDSAAKRYKRARAHELELKDRRLERRQRLERMARAQADGSLEAADYREQLARADRAISGLQEEVHDLKQQVKSPQYVQMARLLAGQGLIPREVGGDAMDQPLSPRAPAQTPGAWPAASAVEYAPSPLPRFQRKTEPQLIEWDESIATLDTPASSTGEHTQVPRGPAT